jgi:ubiquinone/menaquinone biosynthesis C-methylase UbiE
VDFVISSHVIEHFRNPIKALAEWERVARKYIFMIVPHKKRTYDKPRPLTPVADIYYAYMRNYANDTDKHHYTYTPENFGELMKAIGYEYRIIDPDDKVGNGFICIITLQEPNI